MGERVERERREPGGRKDLGVRERIAARAKRARAYSGHDRDTVFFVLKSSVAAFLSWVLADTVLQAQSPAFAPFSAVLMMQATIYRSLTQSLHYVLAIALGVALQGALGFLLGPHLWTFALAAVAALAIGRWRRLGSQGNSVATAAFFAYSTFAMATSTSDRLTQLGSIVVLVLIGSALGVVVNLVLFPPMRYRSARHGVTSLSHAMYDLLGDMSPVLREGAPGSGRTDDWWRRARDMRAMVEQAEASVGTAEESIYFNPRRLLHRGTPGFSGYRTTVNALARAVEELSSIARGLHYYGRAEGGTEGSHGEFLSAYGEFLASIGAITQELSELTDTRLSEQVGAFGGHLDRARRCYERLKETARQSSLDSADHSHAYGILLVDASRLLEEFQYCCEALAQAVGEPLRTGEDRMQS
ncbi:hypothetical protein HDA32_001310 [Spinactinospora alkalitolerans]|uniref:Aromatic acid exporter family member 1 n=1 Tax=Spinactinospora alkalitolerans TaxID=687207 RepID=A0A852TWG4_9ACTN|nr:aromatic acid exporter family protein [Spinactinospora alkalitolerans]NYE46190.1 hypothetical protein [Spinactinospora alkalitolerans]